MNQRHLISGITLAALTLTFAASCDKLSGPGKIETDDQKTIYFIGQQIGKELKTQEIEVDRKILFASINDALDGKEPRVTMEVMQQALNNIRQKATEKQQKEGEANIAKGKEFLEANKSKEGVKTTASGLQYIITKEGSGPKPKESDEVKVNYKGALITGEVFDDSARRGQPAQFPLNQVIKGWTEGLQLLNVGSTATLFIPAELAYGPVPKPGIPANSVLVFEVELLEIVKPAKK